MEIATTSNLFSAIIIVSDFSSSYKITEPLNRMYARSTPTKRPTPAMSRPPHTYHHSSNLHPGHGQTAAKPRSQPSPVVNPKITPRGRVRLAEEFREKTYRDSLCTMCSDTNYSVCHHHFSSTSIKRMFLNQKSSDMTYKCPICKSLEPVVIPLRDQENSAG